MRGKGKEEWGKPMDQGLIRVFPFACRLSIDPFAAAGRALVRGLMAVHPDCLEG